jgi:sulfoxide reductase catalytic subunit YedY
MFIKKTKSWEIKEQFVTDEELFHKRRDFIKLGAASVVSSGAIMDLLAKEYIPTKNLRYKKSGIGKDLELNSFEQMTSYNNFYEFTTSKKGVEKLAHTLKPDDNWKISVGGLVHRPKTVDMELILKKFALEERIYKFRCVEAWAMVVPWVGFPLSSLIKYLNPKSSAKYIKFETLYDPNQFPDQKRGRFAAIDYPYVEALRMDEAMNDLAFVAVGVYGSKMPNSMGAPIRLVVPWKYGFKNIKSIAKITFTDREPINTWQKIAPREYGFYANVNPKVDHPRWSQKKERVLGHFFKQRTKLYNGYANEVASMYKGLDLRRYY